MEPIKGEAATKLMDELNEVLKKHNAEIQIESILKFVKSNGTNEEAPEIKAKGKGVR